MSARRRVAAFWDEVFADLLYGEERWGDQFTREPLRRWRSAYNGTGRGAVIEDVIPEPFLGPLEGSPSAIILALNPGQAVRHFQGWHGTFTDEIRAAGSYTSWAAAWPYLNGSWVTTHGTNRHHDLRLRFLRRWFDDSSLGSDAMLAFELFPWHSTGVTGRMRPDPDIVREFIWEPIAEHPDVPVFAFGAQWFTTLKRDLQLEVVDRLGKGGRDYGSTCASRTVNLLRTPEGSLVIIEKHSGSAAPPSAAETSRLREAIHDYLA